MSVRLEWRINGAAAASFEVWRNTVSVSGTATKIADGVTGNAYLDTTAGAGETLYYWVKAVNSAGTSGFSPAGTVTTPQLPPPRDVLATLDAAGDITITWSAASGAATYDLYRHTSDAVGSASLVSAGISGTNWVDTPPDADTPYYYWLKSRNGSASSAFSLGALGNYAPDAPAAPSLTATEEPGSVDLSWSAAARASVYDVLRDSVAIARVMPGDPLEYSDTSGTPHTLYNYQVVARNYTGSTGSSVLARESFDPVPAAPANVVATDATIVSQVAITWDASSYADTYEVWRNGSLLASGITGTSYNDDVASGTVYSYTVKAVGESGTSAASSADNGSAAAITAPANLVASDDDLDLVALTWDAATGATSYDVYRDSTLLASSVAALAYDDTSATPGTTYSYQVLGKNSLESSSLSTANNGTRPALEAPGSVAATDGDLDKVAVTWATVTGATSYEIHRDGSLLASGETGTSYDDTSAAVGTTYEYKVKAIRTGNNSALSTGDNGTRPALEAPASVAATDGDLDKVTVTWGAVTGATSYEIYRAGSLLVSGETGTSYDDTSAAVGTTYEYKVKAIRSGNPSALSAGDNGTRPKLSTPGSFTATTNLTTGVDLTWSGVADASGGYEITRNGSIIAYPTSGSTSYSDTTASACDEYLYSIRAIRSGNNSDPSSDVLGIRLPSSEFCDGGGLNLTSQVGHYDQTFTVCGWHDLEVHLNAYTVADRLQIYVDSSLYYDSGCNAGEVDTTVTLSAGSHSVQFLLTANCGGGLPSGSVWDLTVDCV